MSTRQAHRGFTLLETMIVVAVLVAAAGIAAAWWNSEAKRQVRADRIGTYYLLYTVVTGPPEVAVTGVTPS